MHFQPITAKAILKSGNAAVDLASVKTSAAAVIPFSRMAAY